MQHLPCLTRRRPAGIAVRAGAPLSVSSATSEAEEGTEGADEVAAGEEGAVGWEAGGEDGTAGFDVGPEEEHG